MSPVVQTATPELRQLAAAMRPDWDITQLDGAFVAAAQGGWTFHRTMAALVPVLFDPDGKPGDLEIAVAAARPLQRAVALPPGENERYAAETRGQMHEGLARRGAGEGDAA